MKFGHNSIEKNPKQAQFVDVKAISNLCLGECYKWSLDLEEGKLHVSLKQVRAYSINHASPLMEFTHRRQKKEEEKHNSSVKKMK